MNGVSENPISFQLFSDREMTKKVDIGRKLRLNTTLYARLSRVGKGDNQTFITPISCSAYSSADPARVQPFLTPIRQCWVLPDYHYVSNSNDEFVFSFPTFGFVARGEEITMQCLVNVCKKGSEAMNNKECNIPVSVFLMLNNFKLISNCRNKFVILDPKFQVFQNDQIHRPKSIVEKIQTT